MTPEEMIKYYENFKPVRVNQLTTALQSLPEFYNIMYSNDIYCVKLKRNLIKATILYISKNGNNYDMVFTQKINRVYRPSVKEWVEPREIEIAKLESVPIEHIYSEYEHIMGR